MGEGKAIRLHLVHRWPDAMLHSATQDGLIVANENGVLVWCNRAAHTLLGGVRLGAAISDYSALHRLFTLEGRPYPSDDLPLARAILHGESCEAVTLKVRAPDGCWTTLMAAAHPLGSRRSPKGAIVLFRAMAEVP